VKNNMSNTPDDLLVKFLLGEATAEEQAQVQEWISESEENSKYFEQFRAIWTYSKQLAAKSTVDENAAWERFKQRTEAYEQRPKVIPLTARRTIWMRAAAILLLICSGLLVYNLISNRSPEMLVVNSGNSTLVQTLPDGSEVTLNKNSSLTYPERFTKENRSVELEGEAFFNVTPDKSKPFVIHASDVAVQVVGTSFNVKSTEVKTEVIVETGVVEVSKRLNSVRVNPNEKAYVLKDADAPVKEANKDELYNYYRTKELVCNGTPLWRLVEVLNEVYATNIVIESERAKNLPITTTFSNQNLDTILTIISETLNVSVEKAGDAILIK
jgi:ferric-dicitrate binding protein FerR (iron transport regulator)